MSRTHAGVLESGGVLLVQAKAYGLPAFKEGGHVGTTGRRTRRVTVWRGAIGLITAVSLFAATASTVRAQTVIAHWPHSPVNRLLRDDAPQVSPSFSANLRGNFVTAANTLLTCPGNPVMQRQRAALRRQGRAAEPCENRNNNDEDMRYVNVDPAGHFNSSRATLALPDGARVVRAYLYWGADLARGVSNSNDASDGAPGGETPVNPDNPAAGGTNTLWTRALMRVGTGGYITIDATSPGRDGAWQGIGSWYSSIGNKPGFAYQVRADVTEEIGKAVLAARARRGRSGRSEKTLSVTVADVQAGRGNNRHGGWTLLVAWEADDFAWRNITLYDGFAYVQVQGGEQKVVGPLDFTGFETPSGGDVDAHVATWAYEGDRSITGDYLALGRLGKTCGQLTHMHDAANPAKPPDDNDNFFNGTISTGGVDLGGRTPLYANQLGFDRDRLTVPEGTIGNGASGARVCLGTVGDTYFFGGIAFDVLIRAPNLHIEKTVDTATADPGDVVTYTTKLSNPQRPSGQTPTEPATNVVVDDPLPSGLDFTGFATNPSGACSYDPDTRIVHCDVGTLAPDGSFTFAVRATVSAAAQGTSPAALINAACYRANSQDQPDTKFTGCDAASVEVPPNPYVDLGVIKSVSADVVAPGATLTWTLVATNHGPGTSTGFQLRDELPPGVAFVSYTASAPLTCTAPLPGATGSLVCSVPSVPAEPAAGSALTVTITATVPAGTPNGTVLRNIATVNGDQSEPTPDPHPNRDIAQTSVITGTPLPDPPTPPPPDPAGPPAPPAPPASGDVLPATALGTRLSLSKRASTTTVTPGATITYRLRVANLGEAGAVNVRVCDPLPQGLIVLRAPGFRREAGGLCRRVGRLAIGAARMLRITTRATRSTPRSITNTATATALNARQVRARATVGSFAPCAAAARRTAADPVAHAAC